MRKWKITPRLPDEWDIIDPRGKLYCTAKEYSVVFHIVSLLERETREELLTYDW